MLCPSTYYSSQVSSALLSEKESAVAFAITTEANAQAATEENTFMLDTGSFVFWKENFGNYKANKGCCCAVSCNANHNGCSAVEQFRGSMLQPL